MGIKINNQAWGQLSGSISDVDTTISVLDASLFPTLGVGDYFYGTLVNSSNLIEIVKVTSIAINDLTVERGAEGTTARPYTSTDRIEQRVTAATVVDLYLENSVNAAASEANALASASIAVSSNIRSAVVHASSTKNVLVVNSVPPFGSLTKDLVIIVEVSHDANDIDTPTLQVDGLPVKDIVKNDDQLLVAGDTGGGNAKKIFAFSELLDKWVLVNPSGTGPPPGSLQFMMRLDEPFGWLRVDHSYYLGGEDSSATHEGGTYRDLYGLLWVMENTVAEISGGVRGASAEADWDSGKTIRMPAVNRFLRAMENSDPVNLGEYQDDQNKAHNHGGVTGLTAAFGNRLFYDPSQDGAIGNLTADPGTGRPPVHETGYYDGIHAHGIPNDGSEGRPRNNRFPLFVKL